MHKLADIIVDKIRNLQKEFDQQFFINIDELNKAWEITAIDPEAKDILEEEQEQVIEQLEINLKEAIAQENYELAQIIKDKIKDIKNK